MTRRHGALEGPLLVLGAAFALAALAGAATAAYGGGEAGVRAAIRATAASELAAVAGLRAWGRSAPGVKGRALPNH